MANTIQGEIELLKKEQAMSRKAVEGYKNQMAYQLRNEMGKDIKKNVVRTEPKASKNRLMRIIDKILSKI